MGSRLRGLFEMSVAIGGTLLFCGSMIQAVGEREEGVTLLAAFSPHLSKLTLGVFLVLGAWVSGILFAKDLFRK
jgi:predicted membrane protein